MAITKTGTGLHRRGQSARLHDHGDQHRAVGRRGRRRERSDAAGLVCVDHRRLHDRLPVRARRGARRRHPHDHRDLHRADRRTAARRRSRTSPMCPSTTADDTATNNTATVETPLNRDADVAISKSVSPAAVLVGQPTTFTVVVTNHGPARVTGLVVQDLLPAGLSFVSASPSQGSYVHGHRGVDDRDAAERTIGDADARGDRDRGRRHHQPRAGRRAGPARPRGEQQLGGGDRERRRQRRRRRAPRSPTGRRRWWAKP